MNTSISLSSDNTILAIGASGGVHVYSSTLSLL